MRGGKSDQRVIIAHEWLTAMGGSDKTLQAMGNALPQCRLLTAIVDPTLVSELFGTRPVERLWTDRLPGASRRWRAYGPLVALAWSTLHLRDTELLISSSHFATKAAGLGYEGAHLCYCYTPMRVAWRPDLELHRLSPRLRPIARASLPAVRAWDAATARSVTKFAGISSTVVSRIRDSYHRDAQCIFPPVDVVTFREVRRLPSRHFLAVGRLIPYKRFDLAVKVCSARGYPLVIAGAGPEEARLRAMAGPSVRFVGFVSNEQYRELLAEATALLFPGEEDFGMVPVEAQAAGCPVVALGKGGALDTIIDGETGVLFAEPTEASLGAGIDRLLAGTWDADRIREWATHFSTERFTQEFLAFVEPYIGG